jgi:hypothetical protein
VAKSEQSTDTVERTLPAPVLPPINSFESVLAEYGVTEANMYVPSPPTVQKQNLDQLCILTTPVLDERGEELKNVIGHSGPMVYLGKEGEKDGDKFSGYDGFYIYAVLHPKKGKTVVTIGRPEGDKQPAIVRFLDSLKAGAWIQIASFKTSSNYHTFGPVPVQR